MQSSKKSMMSVLIMSTIVRVSSSTFDRCTDLGGLIGRVDKNRRNFAWWRWVRAIHDAGTLACDGVVSGKLVDVASSYEKVSHRDKLIHMKMFTDLVKRCGDVAFWVLHESENSLLFAACGL